MLTYQRTRRTREYPGHTPHLVGIRAKMPSKIPPDHLILERRRKEEQRAQAESHVQYNKHFDLKSDWEKYTDKRIQQNTVKRRVNHYLKTQEFTLEERRQRLRDLLAAEDDQYLKEMEMNEETTLERQAKMRQRAKFLKEKREQERLQVVAEKLDQRWRANCEELRATLERRHQDEVFTERQDQMRMKDDEERERRVEEVMYAQLWEEDRLAKMAREEADLQRRQARNMDMLGTLQVQRAAVQQEKDNARRMRTEGADLLKEERELRKQEEQDRLREKKNRQAEFRDNLDRALRLKMKKRAKETQEELALDMKILEGLLEETRNESIEVETRKRELRKEQLMYRDFLAQQKELDALQNAEVDRLVDAAVKEQWQRRIDQWEREKQARKRLLRDVLQARGIQLEEKKEQLRREQEEKVKEQELIESAIAEHSKLEAERQHTRHQESQRYQDDLYGQMEYQRQLAEQEKDEERRRYLKGLEAEAEYHAKLKEALERPVVDKAHPMRRAFMAQQAHAEAE